MGKSQRTKSSSLQLSEIEAFFEQRTPAAAAERWDNVGLLVGQSGVSVRGVVVSDDLSEEALSVARKSGANLIINHHPCIFPKQKGLVRITGTGPSALVFAAAAEGIAVLASHTNFDQCALEVPLAVSAALGFAPEGRLTDGEPGKLVKLVVFVPADHVEPVRSALAQAGAGQIGNYDHCTFGTPGEGTFRGLEGTNPFLGTPGKLERAAEIRLETIFPRGLQKRVLSALKKSHPYEEVAYDLYSVEQSPVGNGLTQGLGYGVYGSLKRKQSLSELAKKAEIAFATRGALLTPAGKTVSRIAFVAGKGTAFMADARAKGCDLFITGEAGYHDARVSAEQGMSVLELGHRESEYFFLQTVAVWMKGLGLPTRVVNTPVQRFI